MAFSGAVFDVNLASRCGAKASLRAAMMSLGTADGDAEQLRRIHAGDAAAASLLVDQYLDRIVAYAFRVLGDKAEAEDVAQESFLRLWRRAGQWRAEAPLIHWLHRVAYHLCIDG
jgi:RNA polymerase sigma-70 factor (ECF subfamily)